MTDVFLTVPQVAERWHVTARAVRDEINRKRLRAAKIGGQWLIAPVDLETFEASRLNVARSMKRTRPPKRRAS